MTSRGGGVGGGKRMDLKKVSIAGTCQKCVGAMKQKPSVPCRNSNLLIGEEDSDFCSDFFLLAISLQSEHGCLPSNVFASASVSGASWENWITMPTHATDWNSVQCIPIEQANASAVRALASRGSTRKHRPLCQNVNKRTRLTPAPVLLHSSFADTHKSSTEKPCPEIFSWWLSRRQTVDFCGGTRRRQSQRDCQIHWRPQAWRRTRCGSVDGRVPLCGGAAPDCCAAA